MKKKTGKRATAILMAAAVSLTSLVIPTGQRAKAEELQVTVMKSWDFSENADGWYDGGAGWDYQYQGRENTRVFYDADAKRLAANVDYTKDADTGWSQMGVCFYEDGMCLKGANQVTFDVYYDTAKRTQGNFSVKAYSNSGVDSYVSLEPSAEQTVEGTIVKVPVTIPFEEITSDVTPDFTLCVIGCGTDYAGTVWFDDIAIGRLEDMTDLSVDATVSAGEGNRVSLTADALITTTAGGEQETTVIRSNAKPVDADADSNTVAVYEYLEAMGRSSSVLYGHQDDTWQKAGAAALSDSDTFDVTGQYAAVVGIDTLSLTGNEYSASRYNEEIAAVTDGVEAVDIAALGNAKANVVAAAKLTNRNIENGSIITMSCHMPNFSIVKENSSYAAGQPDYARYDFSGYTPNTLTGDVANEILPGGRYHEMYCAYLDMIADYASMVDGTILFRPFHEGTGSWFWWGAAFCNEETFKNIYRYTVTYLRDVKDVHNMLYVYGPGSEAASIAEYGARYPGDAYVDMVGFDMYNSDPTEGNETFFTNFANELQIVQEFAREHGKLMAVTETGVATSAADPGENQTALHAAGNADHKWYERILEKVSETDASYFLLWANFSKKDGYYTPYVDEVKEGSVLHGHEMLDAFLNFYNDNRSVFAGDQREALAQATETLSSSIQTAGAANTEEIGFILAPVAGRRILGETGLAAQIVENKGEKVSFVVEGEKRMELPAKVEGAIARAVLDERTLQAMGSCADGSITLVIGGRTQQKISVIFNIEEAEEDPCEIDGFEAYYGVDSLLTKKWSVNKDSGCSLALHLIDEAEKVYEGTYALEFTYDETGSGWAGATISKEVDWSECNALQFYTIPDGKNQKTVIQLTANGVVYETYLNLYEEYAADCDGTPLLVTIPFAEFVQRDTAGQPKGGLTEDCESVTSFGLWVNAIGDSDAVVDGRVSGTLIYDKITAVSTDVMKAVFEKNPALDSGDAGNETENGGDAGDAGSEAENSGDAGNETENGGDAGDAGSEAENGGDAGDAGNETEPDGKDDTAAQTGQKQTKEQVYQNADGIWMRSLEQGDAVIEGAASILPEGASFTTEYQNSGEIFERAVTAMERYHADCTQYRVLEINLYDGNQTQIHQLSGRVKVSLAVPEGMTLPKGKTFVIYRLLEDGTLAECETTVENGTITFLTDHFSTFILAQKEADAPQTGDEGLPRMPFAVFGIGILAFIFAFGRKNKEIKLS